MNTAAENPAELEEAAITVAEFIIRLNIRPTATPDVREAAAMEKLVNGVFRLLNGQAP